VKHLLILLSILLLSSPLFGQQEGTCYVVVDSSDDFDTTLISNISVSLISQYLREVEPIPIDGISKNSCLYQISVSKEKDTTFVSFKGKNLNSYGDSKLTGLDGFQQSVLKSLYRSLRDKRKLICEDYGSLLDECSAVVVQGKRQKGILYQRELNDEHVWYENLVENLDGKYKGEIENGKPNGLGTLTYLNGTMFIGEYKDGREHGQGTVTWSNGDKYVGEWRNGKNHGKGTYTWHDGKKVIGDWRDNQPWNSTFYDKLGNIIGMYVNGVAQ
jgi:hypothetical protein